MILPRSICRRLLAFAPFGGGTYRAPSSVVLVGVLGVGFLFARFPALWGAPFLNST
jgi:hypothetical protein